MKDLFKTPELIPDEVQRVFENISPDQEGDYTVLESALKDCQALGYTFDYDLNGEVFNLRKI